MSIIFPLTCHGIIADQENPGELNLSNITIPSIKDNEMLIRVYAIGVNNADVQQAKGKYPPPPDAPAILGLECSGVVVAKGHAVHNFAVDDRVMSLVTGGAYAEYAVVQSETTLLIPPNLSFIEAAAIPESYHTIWYNVFEKGRLKSGETFLVHGGASGVGSAAIQIAKIMGATVIATVGSDDKINACYQLGADCVINYKKQNFHEVGNEFTKKHGVDVILDWVGAAYLENHMKLLRLNGRLLSINSLTGNEAKMSFDLLLRKCLTITGTRLRPLSLDDKAHLTKEIQKYFLPKLETGKLNPLIYKTLPLEKAHDAHNIMEESKHIGKIILTVE